MCCVGLRCVACYCGVLLMRVVVFPFCDSTASKKMLADSRRAHARGGEGFQPPCVPSSCEQAQAHTVYRAYVFFPPVYYYRVHFVCCVCIIVCSCASFEGLAA